MPTLDRSDPIALLAVDQLIGDLTAGLESTVTVDVDKADAKKGSVAVDLTDYIGDIRHQALDGFTAVYARYVNQHNVPVKRLILTGPEEVDGAALRDAA